LDFYQKYSSWGRLYLTSKDFLFTKSDIQDTNNTMQISARYQSILVTYQLQVDPAVNKLDVYRKIDL